jgi:hypothetical protein
MKEQHDVSGHMHISQNHWGSRICSSSGIKTSNTELRKMDLFPSSGEWRKTSTLLGPLERSNINDCTRQARFYEIEYVSALTPIRHFNYWYATTSHLPYRHSRLYSCATSQRIELTFNGSQPWNHLTPIDTMSFLHIILPEFGCSRKSIIAYYVTSVLTLSSIKSGLLGNLNQF